MGKNPFGWNYPPGAENDPNAPWNQTDATDVAGFEDKLLEMQLERAKDIEGWFIESITEIDDEALKRLSDQWQKMVESGDETDASMATLGRMVYIMIENGCTPDDDDVLEEMESDGGI